MNGYKELKKGVSAVIACHNSSKTIRPTLEALLNQQIGSDVTLEIILADNNCTDDTVEKAEGIYNQHRKKGGGKENIRFTVVREPEPGAAFARKTAVLNASCAIVSFIDDDNILEPRWIQTVVRLFDAKPGVGVIGGLNLPQIKGDKPPWFDKFQHTYACGPQAEKSSDITGRKYVFGAGASFRTEVLLDIYHSSLPLFLSGKKAGAFLLSGNDSELCHRAVLMGWEIWYEETLVLKHNLVGERLNWKSLCKTQTAHSAALIVLEVYRALIDRKKVRTFPALIWFIVKRVYWFFAKHFSQRTLKNLTTEGKWSAVTYHHYLGMVKSALLFGFKYSKIKNKILRHYKNNNFSKFPGHNTEWDPTKNKYLENKHLNAFARITPEEAQALFNGPPPNIKFGDNYRLAGIFIRTFGRNNLVQRLFILWESLIPQEVKYHLAITLLDADRNTNFWIRPTLGKLNTGINSGDLFMGEIEIPGKAVDESRLIGLRMVVPDQSSFPLPVDANPADYDGTRLLLPLARVPVEKAFPPGEFEEENHLESKTEIKMIRGGRKNPHPPGQNKYQLITTLFNEEDPERLEEYITCLGKNESHDLIEHVHVFYDTHKDNENVRLLRFLEKKKHITIVYITGRPTYEMIFNYANAELPNRKIIVCNADIFFNKTLGELNGADLKNKFLVLSRCEILPGIKLRLIHDKFKHPNYMSADAWIFQTPLNTGFTCDYKLGTMFCDAFLNAQLFKSGLDVYNPCISVQACHFHKNWEYSKLLGSDDYSELRKQILWQEERRRAGHQPGAGVYWCTAADLEKPPREPFFWTEPGKNPG